MIRTSIKCALSRRFLRGLILTILRTCGTLNLKGDAMEDYVFISYSSKNNVKAKNFRKVLETNGIRCWRAPESIDTGGNYAKAIPSAIKNCGAVVVLLSQDSQQSQWVPKELDLAIQQQKPILPVYIESCDLIEPFDLYLSNVQAIKMFTQRREAIKNIVERIRAIMPSCVFIDSDESEAEKASRLSKYGIEYDKCPVKIAVVGVGGCGVNIVDKIAKRKINMHKLIAIDGDKTALYRSDADVKLRIDGESDKTVLHYPEAVAGIVDGKTDEIKDVLSDSDWVFIIAGMGGGIGSGGAS